MNRKISALSPLTTFTGEELLVIAIGGSNHSVKFKDLKKIVSNSDLGLDRVSNTSDQDKVSDPLNPVKLALDSKASAIHGHEITDVVGLAAALLSKASAVHQHQLTDLIGLSTELAKYSLTEHKHVAADITDLDLAIENKLTNLKATVTMTVAEW
jgi:hypothetical protein